MNGLPGNKHIGQLLKFSPFVLCGIFVGLKKLFQKIKSLDKVLFIKAILYIF